MKRYLLTLLLIAFGYTMVSATSISRKEDLDDFLKTTTYVVLDTNPMSEWNLKVKPAVEKFWTITPYKFISDKQFEQMRGDKDKSFLVRLKVKYPKDRVKAYYEFMSLVMGSASKDVTNMPEISSIPLGYESADQENWGYKLPSFVRMLQHHVNNMIENPKLISSDDPFVYYNKNIPSLEGKEIWVVEKDLAPEVRSLREVRKSYDGNVRIVKIEDIEEAIMNQNPDVVYLHKVGPEKFSNARARIYKALIGAGDDKIYYFDYHMMSKRKNDDGFLKKDFRRINKH